MQTIVDAFNIALQGNANYGGGNTEVVLEIDGREFGRAVLNTGNREPQNWNKGGVWIMDYVKIGGRSWDVLVIDRGKLCEILYTENTGRTLGIGAPLTIDPLGTFISHSVTFKRARGWSLIALFQPYLMHLGRSEGFAG